MLRQTLGLRINEGGLWRPVLSGGSTLALSLFFTSATAASGTVTDTEGTGNTLTFSRASNATYWDADGVLQTASSGIARVGTSNRKPVTNLLTYPEQFDNAAWTNSNTSESGSQSDPFDGTKAFKLIEADTAAGSTHYIEATTGITVYAKAYTHAVYAKAGERTWLRLGFATAAGVAFFNLSTGVVGTTSGLDAYGIAAVDGAPGWYRCWITDTLAAGTDKPRITLAEADNDVAYDGDGASGLYIFGAMLNEGGIEDYIGATNLLTDDKDFTAGYWSNASTTDSSNSTEAPDGTITADTITASSTGNYRYIAQYKNLIKNETYTFSVFLKYKGCRWLWLLGETSGDKFAWFDIQNGALGTSQTGVTHSITYYGNKWYCCSITFTKTTDSSSEAVGFGFANADNTYAATINQDVYAWGAQLTKGSTLYPYVGMPQTGFTKQGYLAESAATNLAVESEDLSTTWAVANTDSLTVTTNQAVAPDGTTTMDLLTITDTTNEDHGIAVGPFNTTSAQNYCLSGFFKAREQRYIGLRVVKGSEIFYCAVFDLQSGTVTATDVGTSSSSTVTNYGIIPCGNGIYRCFVSGSFVDNVNNYYSIDTHQSATPTFNNLGREAYAGTAGDGFYAWGIQFETGTYPSSYIKTSGGTASRSADVLEDSGLTWLTQGVGTFVVDAAHNFNGTTYYHFDLSDGTNNNAIRVRPNNAATFNVNTGGSGVASIDAGDFIQRARNKVAAGYASDDFAASINGLTAVADTSGEPPVNVTSLAIGHNNAANIYQINGFIRSLQYYKARKSNADLATLSTITDDGTSWRDEQSA